LGEFNLNNYNQEQEVDLWQLLVLLRSNIKRIVIITILLGMTTFLVSGYLIKPEYSSTVKLYVNNKTIANADSLTTSDISAAQQLVGTYVAIIQSDSMLNEVIEQTGIDYTPGQIRGMMSANSVNNTEVFNVTIQGENPVECAEIADEIATISPTKIAEIVEGSSVKILDRAIVNNNPVYPNVRLNTAIGLLLGFVSICLVTIIRDLLDTKIKVEEDIEAISNIPVIGFIIEY
jgi:capsular polysaccharide biosynthesis protein